MLWLGIDIESSGTDPEKDQIIEIGAVVWDTVRSSPIYLLSEYIAPDNVSFRLKKEISELTGIEPQDLKKFGRPLEEVCKEIGTLSQKCSHFIGHFGLFFDRLFLNRAFDQAGVRVPQLPWIDSGFDIPYPQRVTTRKLAYLAAEHGFAPIFQHRAVFDVVTMFKILAAYDPGEIASNARSPVVEIAAKVSYEERQKASLHGFFWEPNEKRWKKIMRQSIAHKTKFPFPISEVIVYTPPS